MFGALTTAGGLLVASGLVSPVPADVRAAAVACLVVLLLLRWTGLVGLSLPQRAWQIPRETFGPSPTRAAFRFAYELGTGVRTYITAQSPYALGALIVLALPAGAGPAGLAAVAGAVGYGLGRSLVVVSQGMLGQLAVDHPRGWLRAADLVALGAAIAVLVLR